MEKTLFEISKMDCPSEEGVIRMALDSVEPKVTLEFDTPNRKVRIFHGDNAATIEARMQALGLGATLEHTHPVENSVFIQAQVSAQQTSQNEARILKWLLAINAVMFTVEITVGWLAQSTGLIADSLDMFADAAVYIVALYAVGKAAQAKLKAAHLSGWLEAALAMGLLIEVVRRAFMGSEPVSLLMMGIGSLALVANVACLMLIYQVRNNGTHMKASMIFSANDVLANAGVILAGGLVALTGSQIPYLVIGVIIGLVVLNGARRILMLR